MDNSNMTVAQLRDNITKVRESCITLSDFVERFVLTSGLAANDVIDFPQLFGGQTDASVHIDGVPLNSDQLRIFNKVMGKLKTGTPFHLFVSGPAGSGKSTLLKAIRNAIRRHFNSDNSCLISAPTVIAAKNVDGGTIHSVFLISWKAEGEINFSPRKKTDVECKIKETKVVLLDSINFVDANVFVQIEQKLRANLDTQKPFGGVSVIVFGDLFQIPPLGRALIYQEPSSKPLWNLMKLEELTKNENSTEPEESDVFDILRSGGSFLTSSMIEYLKKNCKVIGDSKQDVVKALEKLKTENNGKSFAVLALQNDYIMEINKEVLASRGNVKDFVPKACVYKLETPSDVYSEAAPDRTKNLSLAVGSQVMLTANVQNRIHGEIGRVIELNDDSVTVRFSNTPVQIVRCGWHYGQLGWVQFPLVLAEAFSIYKSQGLTFDGVILVGRLDERQSSAVYTALSRAKSLKLCHITHLSTLDSLLNRDMEKEKAEMKRLKSCS